MTESTSDLKSNAKSLFNCDGNLLNYLVKSNVNLKTRKNIE